MTPVRKPAVTASVRPWPSWASKFFSSSAEPSDCESKVTLPSVRVPSTSINKTRICLARFASLLGIFLPRMANAVSSLFVDALILSCRNNSDVRAGYRVGAQHAAPLQRERKKGSEDPPLHQL